MFTRVFPVAYDLVSRVGRLCLISYLRHCHGPVVSPQSCALAARLPTLVPAPRSHPPARPPCALALGVGLGLVYSYRPLAPRAARRAGRGAAALRNGLNRNNVGKQFAN